MLEATYLEANLVTDVEVGRANLLTAHWIPEGTLQALDEIITESLGLRILELLQLPLPPTDAQWRRNCCSHRQGKGTTFRAVMHP